MTHTNDDGDTAHAARKDPQMNVLFDAAADQDYKAIVDTVNSKIGRNKLKRLKLGHPARAHKAVWDSLAPLDSQDNTLIRFNDRIVVPQRARGAILKNLHISHCGPPKTISNAKTKFYWPAMNNDITQMCDSCWACSEHGPSQPDEPPLSTHKSISELEPMEAIGN